MLKNKDIYLIPALGFLTIILIGWIVLMLPICNKGEATILDDIFISVSSVCVNGFSTVDISSTYTFIGQVIIAILTEIGAVGFVTFVSFILNIKKKKMPLSEVLLISNALNDDNYGKIKQRLKEVIQYTLIIELIGSIFLSIVFIPRFGVIDGIWYSIFHSITAFCNAGFDLFGTSGLRIFANDTYINIIFIILMLLGGIGFFVIEDIITCIKKKSFMNIQFHTKIVLYSTLMLYVISCILIKIAEPKLSILQVLFTSATLRTTGFSTIDFKETSSLAKLIFSIIMLIGGAPGSTSGGFRITSFAVVVLTIRSIIENKKDIIVFYRKIDIQTVKQAITNIFICSGIVFISLILMVKLKNMELSDALFMSVSSFSTVGVSTINLANASFLIKCWLMIIMFIGRVGPISIISIFMINKDKNKNIEYVNGNLML